MKQDFKHELRKRILPHAVVFFLGWPILSAYAATVTLKELPITYALSWPTAFLGNVAGAIVMFREFLAVAVILFVLSLVGYSALAAVATSQLSESRRRRNVLVLEPFVFLFSGLIGVAWVYPAMLRHPLLIVLWLLPVMVASIALLLLAFITAAAVGAELGGRRRAVGMIMISVATVAFFFLLARAPLSQSRRRTGSSNVVILGLDSLSQFHEVSLLRGFARRNGGAWYERPVSPGLMTNTVWPAILMHRPVSESRVFMVRQAPDWKGAPFNLVKRAAEMGYRTWSFFSDQFTTYVGSDAGFMMNRSGPRGWLQIATAGVKDGSVFLPLILSHLPAIPGSATPSNQAGTYCFDLRREVNEIVTAGAETSEPDLVVGHIDFLHQPRFPRYAELNSGERRSLRWIAVRWVKDASLDFNYPRVPVDPIRLYQWKVVELQRVVVQEIESSGYLAPARRNKLIILSDHGDRTQLDVRNFGNPEFHRVLFITFGIPARDPVTPISLLDTGEMLGFSDPTRPGSADPVVEFTSASADEWVQLVRSSRLQWNGESVLDPKILAQIGQRLRGYRPYTEPVGYYSKPTTPAGTP